MKDSIELLRETKIQTREKYLHQQNACNDDVKVTNLLITKCYNLFAKCKIQSKISLPKCQPTMMYNDEKSFLE